MSKIKVLYLSHTSRIGGAEVCLLTLVKYLDRTRFDPVVVFPTRGPLRKQIEQFGVRTYISPLEWWIRAPAEFAYKGQPLRKGVQGIVSIIEREKPHLIHTNTSVIWEGALAAQLCRIPHLWHIHEILPAHPVLKPLFPLPTVYNLFGELSQQVVAVSEAVRESIEDHVDTDKLIVIPNGIDTEKFSQEPKEDRDLSLRNELNIPLDAVIALMVGSLVAEKGHDNLLQAAAILKERGCQVHFVLAGGGNPLAVRALQKQVNGMHLHDSVHYLGFRKDVPELLKASDLLVLPSLTDAFPLVVLEAMAAGKPVVATASGGASEMIVETETGFLVPISDPQRLSERIGAMARDSALRQAMGNRALSRFTEKYTAEVYTSRFEQVYEEMMDRRDEVSDTTTKARVREHMKIYENLYYRSQAIARQKSPFGWQAGRFIRLAKQLARKRIYENE